MKFKKKVKNSLKKELDSKPIYNEKYLKAKIKSYYGKINPNFDNNKIPKEDPEYFCLSVIFLDSIFRTGKNYYPQVSLEECKYVIKEKKIHKYIIDDVKLSSDSDKETLLKKVQMEKNSDEENSSEGNYFFFLHIKTNGK